MQIEFRETTESWIESFISNALLAVTPSGGNFRRCSWARQSSGALAIRPKSGDSGYQPSIRLPQLQVTQAGQPQSETPIRWGSQLANPRTPKQSRQRLLG